MVSPFPTASAALCRLPGDTDIRPRSRGHCLEWLMTPEWRAERWTDSFYQDWGLTRLKCSCTTPPPPFVASPLASSATPLYASESPHLTAATFPLIFSADPSSHLPTRGDMVRTWLTVRDFNQSLQNWHEVFCYLLLRERVRDNSQWSGPNTICTKRVG